MLDRETKKYTCQKILKLPSKAVLTSEGQVTDTVDYSPYTKTSDSHIYNFKQAILLGETT